MSTTPDSSWLPAFIAMTEQNPLLCRRDCHPGVGEGPDRRESRRDSSRACRLELRTRLCRHRPRPARPHAVSRPAATWSDENFDHTYTANWLRATLPTLIIIGGDDRIVTQHLRDDGRYSGNHVTRAVIDDGAHFRGSRIRRPSQRPFNSLRTNKRTCGNVNSRGPSGRRDSTRQCQRAAGRGVQVDASGPRDSTRHSPRAAGRGAEW